MLQLQSRKRRIADQALASSSSSSSGATGGCDGNSKKSDGGRLALSSSRFEFYICKSILSVINR